MTVRSRRLPVALGIALAASTLLATPALASQASADHNGTQAKRAGTQVSVLNYGAVGDGGTNDRVAIQRALDDVYTRGGGTVNLPGGHTYLTGDLQLKSNVTLNINRDAVLLQSENASDYAHTPHYGRSRTDRGLAFDNWVDNNYPFVYAGSASNVTVTGAGKIQMSYTGDDDTSIIEHVIGFNLVSNFTISNVTIAGATGYNLAIRNSDHGNVNHVTTSTPASVNSDGISLMNSNDITVSHNNLTTLDDGIYIWASYQDPRKSAWWDSDTARRSYNYNIFDNTVNNIRGDTNSGTFGFEFINWTSAAPDASEVEISQVNIHDNVFRAPVPFGALTDDLFHFEGRKTPIKDITVTNNTLIKTGPDTTRGLSQMPVTNWSGDPVYPADVASKFLNGDFDAQNTDTNAYGTSFWSVRGGAGSSADAIAPGDRHGYINSFNHRYSAIYQGLYLTPGAYTFTARTKSSGPNIRLFVARASSGLIVKSLSFHNTTWQTKTITFTVPPGADGTYHLGIDNNGSARSTTSSAQIDSASIN